MTISNKKIYRPLWLIKLTHYEYWAWQWFYYPLLPYIFYQAWRARCAAFFTCINPSFENSGFYAYSKKAILDLIPKQYKPKTLAIQKDDNTTAFFIRNQLEFPLIAKPDMGERGKGVTKLFTLSDFEKYHIQNIDNEYIVQEYASEKLEFGIFYIRLPKEEKGTISSVTLKEFLFVTGDGFSTLGELILDNVRARFQEKDLRQRFAKDWNRILPQGEEKELEPIGNHCRGTRFINANYLITKQLENVFNDIARQIPGFYYGRFDLRVASIDDLYQGKIKIMELNGANSEPTHIYDASFGVFNAYQTIAWHWKRIADISIQTQQMGVKALPFWKTIGSYFLG
jgi:hypothetical protein